MHRIGWHPRCVSPVVTTGSTIFCGWIESRVIDSECRFESRCTVAGLAVGSCCMCKRGGGRRFTCRIDAIVASRTGYRNAVGRELPQYAVAEDTAHVVTGGVVAKVTGG